MTISVTSTKWSDPSKGDIEKHGEPARNMNCAKITYPNEKAAKAAIRHRLTFNARHRKREAMARAYYCWHCSGWHLSTHTKLP